MKSKNIFALIMLTTLSSCSGEKTHDVQYYLDNPQERITKIKDCKNNSGEKMNTPNCQNAAEALHQAMFKSTSMPQIK